MSISPQELGPGAVSVSQALGWRASVLPGERNCPQFRLEM